MERLFFLCGTLFAFISVGAGAFGAHGLKGRLTPDMLAVYEIAVTYQMSHALALLAAAWAVARWPGAPARASGFFFIAGIVVFSGSLYMLSLTGIKWLGAITPIGGVAFLVGWLCLAWAALKS